jgi:hypothetical protein
MKSVELNKIQSESRSAWETTQLSYQLVVMTSFFDFHQLKAMHVVFLLSSFMSSNLGPCILMKVDCIDLHINSS